MQYLLFILLLLGVSCLGQKPAVQSAKIDTAKLFNPNNHPDNAGAKDLDMFKRSIAVVENGYTLILNDKETSFRTLKEVESFVKSNKVEIQKSLFYILMISTADFKLVLPIIGILTKNQVTDYKVINVQSYFTPPPPVTIQAPVSVETTSSENDSTYFLITILDTAIEVKLSGKGAKLQTREELDSFIATNKPAIKKILIIISRELSNEKIKPVLEVLKRHEFYTYHLVSK